MTNKEIAKNLIKSIHEMKHTHQCEFLINAAGSDQNAIENKLMRMECKLRNDDAKRDTLQYAIENNKFQLNMLDSIFSRLSLEAEYLKDMKTKRKRLESKLFSDELRIQGFGEERKVRALFESQLHCDRQQKTVEFIDRLKDRLKQIQDPPPDKGKVKLKTPRKAA